MYVLFDYSRAIRFHDKVIPNKFIVTEGGKTVIESQVESLADPPSDVTMFQSSGLSAIGVGPVMSPPLRLDMTIPSNTIAPGDPGAAVVLHGMRSPDGRLSELEVICSTNPALTEMAMKYVSSAEGSVPPEEAEPGVTPRCSEVLYTV